MTLFDIAYRKELVAARRLAARDDIPLEAALQTILKSKLSGSLQQLVEARQQEQAAASTRKTARADAKAAARLHKMSQATPDPATWLAWFDGSAHPNPGRMGIGGLLRKPDGGTIEISESAGYGNSSEAEYCALIALLRQAVPLQPTSLTIYGDSRVVIDDVDPACRKPSVRLSELREQAQELLRALPAATLQWIPRHRNSAADALSQQAVARTGQSSGAESNVPLARLAAIRETQ